MQLHQNRRRNRHGFTFLEIMFVVVIIGILLALVGPRLLGRSERARETATKAQIENLSTAIKNYEMDIGRLPRTLEDLIEDPGNTNNAWDGPYLGREEIPKDAWGRDFIYKAPGTNNKRGFDLSSMGSDGDENTDDDIINWRKR